MKKGGKAGLPRWIVSDWLADDDRRAERLLTVLVIILVAVLAFETFYR